MGLALTARLHSLLSKLRTLLRELGERVANARQALQHEVAERERPR